MLTSSMFSTPGAPAPPPNASASGLDAQTRLHNNPGPPGESDLRAADAIHSVERSARADISDAWPTRSDRPSRLLCLVWNRLGEETPLQSPWGPSRAPGSVYSSFPPPFPLSQHRITPRTGAGTLQTPGGRLAERAEPDRRLIEFLKRGLPRKAVFDPCEVTEPSAA